MEFQGRKRVSANLNIAPLVDVVFLLLVFFMLSSHFVHDPGIKIKLPDSETAVPQRENDIVVFVAGDGSLYIGGERIGIKELPDNLKARVENGGKKKMVIKADEKVDLALAVRVMDIVKRAGSESLIISTGRKKDDTE